MAQNKWWVLAAVCIATFMLLLDITVVNVALPDISESLGASFSDLQWVIDAYALALAAFLLTAGSIADRIGHKRVFVAGLVVFVVASVLCGVAGTPTVLNLARGLQGVGGAAMFACSLALLAGAFQGRDRGTAFGIWGATTGAAVAIGPLVGGALTEGIGWEAIFFVNVPIGALAVVLSLRYLRDTRSPVARRIDWAGATVFSAALFLLVFALVRGNAEGWGSTLIVGFLAASAVLLVAFVVLQRRLADPMLDLALFRKPAFAGASIAAFALSASMFSMFLYLTLYLQNQLGYAPLETGLRFLPVTLLSFLVAPVAGRLSARMPVRLLLGGGLALVGVGLLLMRGVGPESDWTALLAGFLFAGAGIGMVNPPLASTAVGVVDPQRSGMASGINSTFRQVGIATGIAGLGALFQARIEQRVLDEGGLALVPAAGGSSLGEALSSVPLAAVDASSRAAVRAGFTGALDDILLVAAAIAFAGAVLSLLLVRGQDFIAPVENR